jgi:hypothetical protein
MKVSRMTGTIEDVTFWRGVPCGWWLGSGGWSVWGGLVRGQSSVVMIFLNINMGTCIEIIVTLFLVEM